jgi:hypothetical protein
LLPNITARNLSSGLQAISGSNVAQSRHVSSL